jgi:mRNA-degrading endonuclease RelE of RelBE toxin-antitoxin system
MNSRTTDAFWKLYETLPHVVRLQAKKAFAQFQANPHHRSLHFKRVHDKKPIYSARISRDYRVVGRIVDDEIIWYWVGSHAAYDRLLAAL